MQDDQAKNPPPADIGIRAAVAADLEAIATIYNDAILNSTATFDTQVKAASDLLPWFQSHDARHPFLVATNVDGGVLGWAALHPWSDRCAYADTAEISVYIHPSHRGRRIGHRLVADLLRAGREARLHTVVARISEGNTQSIRLHESFGFQMVGTMKEVGRKFGRFIDVHLMQLRLGAGRP